MSASWDLRLKLWDAETGQEISNLARGGGLRHHLQEAWLGDMIECPSQGCGLQLKVSPFVPGWRRS